MTVFLVTMLSLIILLMTLELINKETNVSMQYILSKEEYNDLVPKSKYNEERDKVEKLNIQVLELSEFICIKEKPRLGAYCDSCPIIDTCTQSKEFSK